VAHHHRGEGNELRLCLMALEQLAEGQRKAAESARARARDEATENNKTPDEIERAGKDAYDKAKGKRRALERAMAELRGLQFLAQGETDLAQEQFDEAGDITKARLARYCFLTGDHTRSRKLLDELVNRSDNEVPPLAVQVDLLHRMRDRERAREAFARLRSVAAHADLDSPLVDRLSRLAKQLEWPRDWREKPEARDDTGDRPDLASLGPVHWGPSRAPAWTLTDASGRQHSSASYQGRPVVVIFYLGFGCLHCVEQLHVFAPLKEEFESAGISLVGISTETRQELLQARENFSSDEPFPIQLFSNAALDVFKAFRAFDDFEQMPLHGTFLIDARGMVRWSDVSYEPFMDATFLLQESRRLLGMDASQRLAGASSSGSF
jgi:peroxiredoxin